MSYVIWKELALTLIGAVPFIGGLLAGTVLTAEAQAVRSHRFEKYAYTWLREHALATDSKPVR